MKNWPSSSSSFSSDEASGWWCRSPAYYSMDLQFQTAGVVVPEHTHTYIHTARTGMCQEFVVLSCCLLAGNYSVHHFLFHPTMWRVWIMNKVNEKNYWVRWRVGKVDAIHIEQWYFWRWVQVGSFPGYALGRRAPNLSSNSTMLDYASIAQTTVGCWVVALFFCSYIFYNNPLECNISYLW